MKKLICILLAAAILVCLCACGAEKTGDEMNPSDELVENRSEAGDAPADLEKPTEAPELPILASRSEEKGDADLGGEGFAYGADDAYLGESAGYGPGEPSDNPAPEIRAEAGTLTAGEWKDNDNFSFWRDVLSREEWVNYAGEWKFDLTKRLAVTVTDGQNPAKNVKVGLLSEDGEILMRGVTDSYGKAYFYYGLAGGDPSAVEAGGARAELTADDLEAGGVSISAAGERYTKLDLMFTTDTTGSMADELEYLKKELGNVIERVAGENEGLDIRLSVNFYRDEGDDYVVRDFPFSGDVDEVLLQLDQQFSDGGGDYPEAVHTALANSVSDHEWREDAVKLLFLTLDAPGHSEVGGVPESIVGSTVAAAENGVRIIPVAASGVDGSTEFMLRAMACVTGGTYVFLTDDSGVGESHLEPTIGDYNVKKLNDLLVKIISEYCK